MRKRERLSGRNTQYGLSVQSESGGKRDGEREWREREERERKRAHARTGARARESE